MVKLQKELTHIYHESRGNAVISIGDSSSVNARQDELFSKSLALTQDLKRLPFLLGGKVYFWLDAHALYNVGTATLTGLGITVVLLNGNYDAAEFDTYADLVLNERAQADVLMVCHGSLHYHAGANEYGVAVNATPSHWDFEGNVVLFDTISMFIFLDADTNVAAADYAINKVKAEYEIEVDWRPFSKAELQEFIMEHIYAKQGD